MSAASAISRRKPVSREATVQPPTRKILRYIAPALAGFAARPKSGPSGRSAQRRVDIAPEVLDVFDSGGEPQQVGRTGRVRPLDRGAMFDKRFDSAKRGRPLPHPHVGGGCDRSFGAAAHANRQPPPKAALHLASCDVVAWVMWESRIEHGGDGS